MKCPQCNATIYENDKFCGECGYDLRQSRVQTHEEKESDKLLNEENGRTAYAHHERPSSEATLANQPSYFNEAIKFMRSAIISPESVVKEKRIISPWISIIVPIVLLFLFSVLTLIVLRSSIAPYAYMEISAMFQVFFYSVLTFALFYFVLFLMNKIIVENSAPWDKVLNDYTSLSIIIIGCYIIAILLLWTRLYEISFVVSIIESIIFYIAPIYIFLKYAEYNKSKLDTFYSLFIYIILTAIAYYIIIRMIIVEIENTIAPYWFY